MHFLPLGADLPVFGKSPYLPTFLGFKVICSHIMMQNRHKYAGNMQQICYRQLTADVLFYLFDTALFYICS